MRQEIIELYRKGNVIELALAIIVAQYAVYALNAIMNDLLLPLLGLVLGGRSFVSLFINLTPGKLTPQGGPVDSIEKAHYVGAPIIAYGSCITSLLQLVVVALVMRVLLGWLRKMQSANQVKISMPVPIMTEKGPLLEDATAAS